LKITILQGAFLPVPPALGGAVEKMWLALGKEFVRAGHEVVHVSRCYDGFPNTEQLEGVVHRRVGGYTTPTSGIYLKWLDMLYTLRARTAVPADSDVVVTNTFWAPLLLTSALRRRCLVDVQRMPKGQMRWYGQAARLRANSTPVAEAICRELPATEHQRVVMLPNPLPFANPPGVTLATKQPILLYVGRVHPEKGLDLLLNAFRQLPPGWRLRIVGPWQVAAGGGGEAYLHTLKKLSEGQDVDFIGPVYDMQALSSYYAEAAVFVYPSVAEQGETFGLAPLEAMAWGCVPIVSALACFRDFIEPGRNGLIFDHRHPQAVEALADALRQVQQNTGLRMALAEQAIYVRETHSTTRIAAEFLAEFQRMIVEKSSTLTTA
jgi:glycosyltransferase involved in cell wall biosynthesis